MVSGLFAGVKIKAENEETMDATGKQEVIKPKVAGT
jgi:hypothetical protein